MCGAQARAALVDEHIGLVRFYGYGRFWLAASDTSAASREVEAGERRHSENTFDEAVLPVQLTVRIRAIS